MLLLKHLARIRRDSHPSGVLQDKPHSFYIIYTERPTDKLLAKNLWEIYCTGASILNGILLLKLQQRHKLTLNYH